MTIHQYSANDLQGNKVSLNKYKGRPVLIVNTASHCKYTPQYQGLEELYQKYKDRGFIVLGFPCNGFGEQEPGDADSISNTCYHKYQVSFPIFSKIEVNGPGTHPLYRYLKKAKGRFLGRRILWNFDKFLINKEGMPVKRFMPFTQPVKLGQYIEMLL